MNENPIKHEFVVKLTYSESTGQQLTEQWFNANGVNGRPDGKPSYQGWNEDTGLLEYEEYRNNEGKLHRVDGGPAIIEYNSSGDAGNATIKKWYMDGVNFRDGDLPSEVVSNPKTGVDFYERYTDESGCTFRGTDYPAIITRDEKSGVITSEHFDGADRPILRP